MSPKHSGKATKFSPLVPAPYLVYFFSVTVPLVPRFFAYFPKYVYVVHS